MKLPQTSIPKNGLGLALRESPIRLDTNVIYPINS